MKCEVEEGEVDEQENTKDQPKSNDILEEPSSGYLDAHLLKNQYIVCLVRARLSLRSKVIDHLRRRFNCFWLLSDQPFENSAISPVILNHIRTIVLANSQSDADDAFIFGLSDQESKVSLLSCLTSYGVDVSCFDLSKRIEVVEMAKIKYKFRPNSILPAQPSSNSGPQANEVLYQATLSLSNTKNPTEIPYRSSTSDNTHNLTEIIEGCKTNEPSHTDSETEKLKRELQQLRRKRWLQLKGSIVLPTTGTDPRIADGN